MDIQPLTGILTGIGANGEWEQQRQLQQLKEQWRVIVGETVAQHSCPLDVRQGCLQVATSTAIWAQNLSFERRRILNKLNRQLQFQALDLKDIRFSTAQWHNRPGSSGAIAADTRLDSYQQRLQWQQHPSRLPSVPNQGAERVASASLPAPSAAIAFARWSQRRQQQVKQVPACPRCGIPSPAGELQRWGVCAFCMTQRWQAEHQANQPDGQTEADSWKAQAGSADDDSIKLSRPDSVERRSFQGDRGHQSDRSHNVLADLSSSRHLTPRASSQGSQPQQPTRPTGVEQGAGLRGKASLSSGHAWPEKRRR